MTDAPSIGPAVLFVPASNERALAKARELPASALIIDLEDAVAPTAKDDAREAMREALRSPMSMPVSVRINGLDTPWFAEDLLAARAIGPNAIVLPKVETADDLRMVETALTEMDAPSTIGLWAMIETPRGVRDVHAVAMAGGRLEALIAGTNDLVAATGVSADEGRAALRSWLSGIVLAARCEGLLALDGVRNDWGTPAFKAEAEEGRRLGFDGKTLIHPAQIEATLAAFRPSDGEIVDARAIVDAFGRVGKDVGLVVVDGRMVERLHLHAARRLLARIGTSEGTNP